MLLDIGAQVSILSRSFLKDNFPDLKPQPLNEIKDNADTLRLMWGNSSDIPIVGWVNLQVVLGNQKESKQMCHI